MKIYKGESQDSVIYCAPSQERVKRFRKLHSEGDILKGKVLRYFNPRQALIQVDEQQLMARLKTNPLVGEEVIFRVEQLYLHIVLKECSSLEKGLNTYI